MKLTVSTLLVALSFVTLGQGAVIPPNLDDGTHLRRNWNNDGQDDQSFMQGGMRFMNSVAHQMMPSSSAQQLGSQMHHHHPAASSHHHANAWRHAGHNAQAYPSSSNGGAGTSQGSSYSGTSTGSSSSPTSSGSGSSYGGQSSSTSPSWSGTSSSSSSSSTASSTGTGQLPSHGLNQERQNMPLSKKPKFGLAWANGGSMKFEDYANKKVSWYYSWRETPGWKNAPTNITFCPMLWGYKNADKFGQHVTNNPNAKYNQGKCVMGMNEVNQKGQANMSPMEGCQLMRKYISPLKQHGFYVVSPVTTSAPNGVKWMNQFKNMCPDVWNTIDAVAVHYYDTSVSKFKNYVNEWHNRFQKPIWVTEYACQNFNGGQQCSKDDATKFHLTMARWFDNQPYVEAYAPFGVMQNMGNVASVNQLAQGSQPSTLYQQVTSV